MKKDKIARIAELLELRKELKVLLLDIHTNSNNSDTFYIDWRSFKIKNKRHDITIIPRTVAQVLEKSISDEIARIDKQLEDL